MAMEASKAKEITIKLSYDLDAKKFVYDKRYNTYSIYEFYSCLMSRVLGLKKCL